MSYTDRRAPARQFDSPDPRYRQPANRQDTAAYPPDEDAEVADPEFEDGWEIPPAHNRSPVLAPVGSYVAVLEGMRREKKTRYAEVRIRFDFRIYNVIVARDRTKADAIIGEIINGWANLSMGPRSTMRKWSEALLGRELDEDEQPKKEDLIGQMVEISIIPSETERGEKTTKIGELTVYIPPDEPAKPARPTPRPAATAAEISGKPAAPRRPAPAPASEPVAQAAPVAGISDDPDDVGVDPFAEPWEEDDVVPGAVDPVLAARSARRG